MDSIIGSLIGTIIGGIITFFVSRYYYMKSSVDLMQEASKLRNLIRIILESLESAKMVQLHRDKSGQIIGMNTHGDFNLMFPAFILTISGHSKNSVLNIREADSNPK